ncbi:MAG: cytochrome c [Acidobacteriota bacterium]|nr:cytochrome c [Acidobacteriota bacterium]
MKLGTQIAVVAVMAATTMSTAFAQGTGAENYKAKCAMCHAADGSASGPAGKSMKVPPFSASKQSEAEMITETKAGKGKMPAFASKLTDAQIKDVVTYVKSLK